MATAECMSESAARRSASPGSDPGRPVRTRADPDSRIRVGRFNYVMAQHCNVYWAPRAHTDYARQRPTPRSH